MQVSKGCKDTKGQGPKGARGVRVRGILESCEGCEPPGETFTT